MHADYYLRSDVVTFLRGIGMQTRLFRSKACNKVGTNHVALAQAMENDGLL